MAKTPKNEGVRRQKVRNEHPYADPSAVSRKKEKRAWEAVIISLKAAKNPAMTAKW
jgi:hypothetical protein